MHHFTLTNGGTTDAVVNFFYLLTQMAIAVEDVGVRDGVRKVIQFVRASIREVAGIFGVVLLLVGITTVASILATAGLGLIAVVPFVGLAMVPLQLGAWLLRGMAFEYLGLSALGAYLTQYRHYQHSLATVAVPAEQRDEKQRAQLLDYYVRDVAPELASDRVRVTGARGKPAPDTLKATVCVSSGTLGEAEISYAGRNAAARAQLAAQTIRVWCWKQASIPTFHSKIRWKPQRNAANHRCFYCSIRFRMYWR